MIQNNNVLKNDEKVVFELRSLYNKYGYTQYKMSKFEEYDLYVRNKDFLVSDNIITFNDTDGKLMALKPDVTLSIIKNSKDSFQTQKVYYNENVYRISKGSHSFKEIMQTGLECIGDIDVYCIYEVLMLALESLKSISDSYVLDISHMGIIKEIIQEYKFSSSAEKRLIKCFAEKNVHEIEKVCESEAADEKAQNILKALVLTYGKPKDVINKLKKIIPESASLCELEEIAYTLTSAGYKDNINIDFSVINDMNYYNGIVFKGFIDSIPSGVLSGGQYDNLMKKMGRKSKAIGFAVYLDMLERLNKDESEYDVDTVILYEEPDLKALNDAVKMLTDNGKSVSVQKCAPEGIKYKQLLKIKGRVVEIVENNA